MLKESPSQNNHLCGFCLRFSPVVKSKCDEFVWIRQAVLHYPIYITVICVGVFRFLYPGPIHESMEQ